MIKKIILIIAISAAISSCYESVNPLGNLKDAVIDDNLIGLGKFKNKLSDGSIEVGYFLIQKGLNNYYQIYTQDKPFVFNNSALSNFQAFITKINNRYYLNLQPLQIEEGKHVTKVNKEYIFAHFTNKNNKLTLNLFNEDFIRKSIKKKSINPSRRAVLFDQNKV